ncbi:MAG: serpin family protein [Bacillota bacterium]
MNRKVSVLLLLVFLGGVLMVPSSVFAGDTANKQPGEVGPLPVSPISLPLEEPLQEFEKASARVANALYDLGLFKGTGRSFALEKPVTRAEALTMILRLVGQEKAVFSVEVDNPFQDVVKEHWAFNHINYGLQKGYVAGTGPTAFEPERKISEQEFIKMLLSAMGYQDMTLENVYEKALEAGVWKAGFSKTAIEDVFLRGKMVDICYQALLGKTVAGEFLWKSLVGSGLLDEGKLKEIMDATDSVAQAGGFAWDLNKLMPQDRNYMFSPLSIKMALAMAAAGAEGDTKKEILEVLGIGDLDGFMGFSKQLIKDYSENDKVALNIANSIWLNEEYYPGADFSKTYKETIADYFYGESSKVNFTNAVAKINGWVNEKTKGKIPTLVEDSDFLAYLVNAIYFKGEWARQFNENATKPRDFTDRNGVKTELNFMNQVEYFDYYGDAALQMVRLPYKDGKTSMYVALPETKELDLISYIEKMKSTKVDLSIPKFRTELSVWLNDVLKHLGIVEAFVPRAANFKPMFTGVEKGENVFISDVVHKTFIEVDEHGTEAAAVTGIGMKVTGMPMPVEPVVFTADRPFTYFIYDDLNQEILFMGEQAFAE